MKISTKHIKSAPWLLLLPPHWAEIAPADRKIVIRQQRIAVMVAGVLR